MYRVDLRRRVLRQLEDLRDRDRGFMLKAFEQLEEDPRPAGVEKIKGTDIWRIRRADYRAVYHIDDLAQTVTIVRIGHRRDVYRGIR